MSSSESFHLPYPFLLVSIILSSTCMGLMFPYASTLPFVFGSIIFTLIYHSLFLISSINENQPRFHISPLDHPHIIWIFIIALFWLAVFVHSVNALLSGNTLYTDMYLVIFAGLEFVLTMHVAYLCAKELQKQRARWKTDVDNTISIETIRWVFFFFTLLSLDDVFYLISGLESWFRMNICAIIWGLHDEYLALMHDGSFRELGTE